MHGAGGCETHGGFEESSAVKEARLASSLLGPSLGQRCTLSCAYCSKIILRATLFIRGTHEAESARGTLGWRPCLANLQNHHTQRWIYRFQFVHFNLLAIDRVRIRDQRCRDSKFMCERVHV